MPVEERGTGFAGPKIDPAFPYIKVEHTEETLKAEQRWAAHEATAKELAKIEVQLVQLNNNLRTIIDLIMQGVNKM